MSLKTLDEVLNSLQKDQDFSAKFIENKEEVLASLALPPSEKAALEALDVKAFLSNSASVNRNTIRLADI
jgi:hypothetical protein